MKNTRRHELRRRLPNIERLRCAATLSFVGSAGMVYVVNMQKYRTEAERESAGAWARGVALELPGRGRVRVLLPDTGATLLAHWSALRPARPHFTTHRALVCTLLPAAAAARWRGSRVQTPARAVGYPT